ncbi:putative MscS Mechanosensitive ion channel [Leptolyngbya boryana NIES-2135]|jgi:small conductance mechanosensitive channel|uniref:Putative MscS Mechanosensitive ion channel n=1 Tax=Leptolyngbya boryana NIES-2135 TaxID=1973484 RepID=A0A1Z4JCC2_LEPBY|nr:MULTISPECIES: mechanosensitive ion channel family protein [Leptolyngbya]BAY54391.1 putative MscS Mechanosensitive ion channel [Leptolyngbya boryana NIES-2135]MBD2370100.1 mechanosensitive ion channel family protein [Leptolyngbya sp. FACHB-161]MBD2376433.1 mechanosensitive ion channel family protein [Leptolyngbya sp. FACHB-238]MBD2400707.1 mechanosensitive ion channel family protein [Leptolyngbya sp. FACHB-239]MBD2407250.1 mechanosensitive ion channel family protein [Leptolyngbya sp. FACHB-4
MTFNAQTVTSLSDTLINLASQNLPKVIWAIVILLVTRWIADAIRPIGFRILKYAEPTLQKFLIQVASIMVWIAGTVAALNAIGIQTTTVITIIGAAGLAIGLALQNSLSHFAAGVMLVSFRPFEVGDSIEGAGVAGMVDSIGLFSTTIVSPDNVRITVPNSNLFSGTLKNNTIMGTRRVDLQINIGHREIDSTMTHLLSLVQPHPLVLREPRPTCHVESITPDATILYLRPWCAAIHHEQVRSEILQLVQEALQSIPAKQAAQSGT